MTKTFHFRDRRSCIGDHLLRSHPRVATLDDERSSRIYNILDINDASNMRLSSGYDLKGMIVGEIDADSADQSNLSFHAAEGAFED